MMTTQLCCAFRVGLKTERALRNRRGGFRIFNHRKTAEKRICFDEPSLGEKEKVGKEHFDPLDCSPFSCWKLPAAIATSKTNPQMKAIRVV